MYNLFLNVSLILKHSVLRYYCYPVLPTYITVKLTLRNSSRLELSVNALHKNQSEGVCPRGDSVLHVSSKFSVEMKPWVRVFTCFETMK